MRNYKFRKARCVLKAGSWDTNQGEGIPKNGPFKAEHYRY